jgi:hypothetical protein
MTAALGILDVLVFAGSLWLGLYLIGRGSHFRPLMLAGLGLVAYAIGWGLDLLSAAAPTVALERALGAVRWPFYSLPALLWTAVLIALLPDGRRRARLEHLWRFGCVPAAVLCYMAGIGTGLSDGGRAVPPAGIIELVLGLVVLAPMLMALGWVWCAINSVRPRNATGILLSATLFFGLGTGLLLLPALLPRFWVLLLIGPDLVLLGVSIAAYDAFDQGEALLPDFLRSLAASTATALLFGGQVALVMALATGARFPLLVLLLATITTAIADRAFSRMGIVSRPGSHRRHHAAVCRLGVPRCWPGSPRSRRCTPDRCAGHRLGACQRGHLTRGLAASQRWRPLGGRHRRPGRGRFRRA